jgi:hypothetical protein
MRKIQFSNNNMVVFVSIDYKLTHCSINTSLPGAYDLYAVFKNYEFLTSYSYFI